MKIVMVVTVLALNSTVVLGAAPAEAALYQPAVAQLAGSTAPVEQMQNAATKEILKQAQNTPPASGSPPKSPPTPGNRSGLVPYNGVILHKDRHIIMCPPGSEYKPRIGKCAPYIPPPCPLGQARSNGVCVPSR